MCHSKHTQTLMGTQSEIRLLLHCYHDRHHHHHHGHHHGHHHQQHVGHHHICNRHHHQHMSGTAISGNTVIVVAGTSQVQLAHVARFHSQEPLAPWVHLLEFSEHLDIKNPTGESRYIAPESKEHTSNIKFSIQVRRGAWYSFDYHSNIAVHYAIGAGQSQSLLSWCSVLVAMALLSEVAV